MFSGTQKCVDKDPAKRWSCERLLMHPYFEDYVAKFGTGNEGQTPLQHQSAVDISIRDAKPTKVSLHLRHFSIQIFEKQL